jgi:hypothetical protein
LSAELHPDLHRAAALLQPASDAEADGDLRGALAILEEVRAVFQVHKTEREELHVLARIARLRGALGQLGTARTQLGELERRYLALGDEDGVAMGRLLMGAVLLAEGDPDAAVVTLRGAWMHYGREGNAYGLINTGVVLADALQRLGRESEADGVRDTVSRVQAEVEGDQKQQRRGKRRR